MKREIADVFYLIVGMSQVYSGNVSPCPDVQAMCQKIHLFKELLCLKFGTPTRQNHHWK